jgi:hypothetical protein
MTFTTGFKLAKWFLTLGAFLAAALWTNGLFHSSEIDLLQEEVAQLERREKQLKQIVERLSAEQRLAEVDVIDQSTDEVGRYWTTIRFIEFDRQDRPLPEHVLQLPGTVIFFDALVVKFTEEMTALADPLRGKSIALFRRVYSENQAPIDGQLIDPVGAVPDVYRLTDQPSDFEIGLWADFWSYAIDPAKAKADHVRVAQGEAVYAPLAAGEKWTLTLENDGGLNLAKRLPTTAPAEPAIAAKNQADPDL